MPTEVPDFGKLDREAPSDEIAVKTPWGLGRIRTRDVLTLLPWVAILAIVWILGQEYLVVQRQAIVKLAAETQAQHQDLLKISVQILEEQQLTAYLSSLPMEMRPRIKPPKGIQERLDMRYAWPDERPGSAR